MARLTRVLAYWKAASVPWVAVKHEWASLWCPALRREAGHSRLTAGHRCPVCTTVAGAILLGPYAGGDIPLVYLSNEIAQRHGCG
jgi:hypothetical protein